MKNRFITLFFLTIGISAGYADGVSDTLRVMTYNLRFGELASMKDFADYIKEADPDIVALQEVDWKTKRERAPRQNGVAMINELAYHTGLFGIYGKAIDYRDGFYGIGILSKYPVLAYQRIHLPNSIPIKEQRTMLLATIELPNKQHLTFICTHLEVSSEEKRIEQIRFILQEVKSIEGPVLLAGDFNARPDSKVITEEMNGWINATNAESTYHTDNPTIKIDYIYMLPDRGMHVLDMKRGDAKLSDHFPLITDFIVK